MKRFFELDLNKEMSYRAEDYLQAFYREEDYLLGRIQSRASLIPFFYRTVFC